MPFATPKPSGEWHAATSVQASLIFGAGAAIAGEKNCRLEHASGRGDADGADSLEKRSPGRLNGRCYVFAHGSPLHVGVDRCDQAALRDGS